MGRRRNISRTPAIPPEEFEHVRGFVEEVHAALEAAGVSYAEGDVYRAVGRLAYWCWLRGIPLDADVVLDDATISRWMATGLRELAIATRRNYRAIARTAGRVLADPRTLPVKVPSVPTPRAEWPYTSREIGVLTVWAAGQRTAYARHNAVAMVALGLGCGLRAHEFLTLRGRDVTVDDAGVMVTVTAGQWPRTVPVLARWEAEVADLAAEVDPGAYLFRPDREVSRPNSVHVFLRDANPPECGVSLNRMRVTWIVGHLTAGVPLAALLQAAGIVSVTSLERYARYLTDPSRDEVRAALRAERAARRLTNLEHVREGDRRRDARRRARRKAAAERSAAAKTRARARTEQRGDA